MSKVEGKGKGKGEEVVDKQQEGVLGVDKVGSELEAKVSMVPEPVVVSKEVPAVEAVPEVKPEVVSSSVPVERVVDASDVDRVFPSGGRSRLVEIARKQQDLTKRAVSVDQTGFSMEASDPLFWLRSQEPGFEWHMVSIPRPGSPTFNLETLLLQNYTSSGYEFLTVDMVSEDEGDDAILMRNIVSEDGKVVYSNSFIMFMDAESAHMVRLRRAKSELPDRSGREYDVLGGHGSLKHEFHPLERELQIEKVE